MPITRREALLSAAALAAAGAVPPASETQASLAPQGKVAGQPSPASDPAEPACLTDFEPLARERMSHMAWEYVNGGVADEITVRWNREALDRIRLQPNILVDVSKLDTRVRIFDQEMPFPIVLAPTSAHRVVHPEGEIATARGAGAAGATMAVSTLATTSIGDVGAAATGPLWFQLYVQNDRAFTHDLVQRAEAAGCRALCLTVDLPVPGARNRETRAKFELPPGTEYPNLKGLKLSSARSHLPGEGGVYSALLSPNVTWKEVDWLRSFAKVPLLLKGVLNPGDADLAVKAGVSGLIVSNHGGRNLDTLPATAEALPRVTEKVAGRVPVLMDGGVRRGTDVLKALALGARAVLIGRPYLYGLAVAGADGVSRVVNILRAEFEMAMALTGRATVASIDRSVLWPASS